MIADFLGADALLRDSLITYIVGYAIGLIPQLLAQQIAAFLQLERQSTRCYVGIVGMIAANIFFDTFFTACLNMGVRGLALATSMSNWVYFLILVPYYFGRKSQLRYDVRAVLWKKLPELLTIGLPGAGMWFRPGRAAVFTSSGLLFEESDGEYHVPAAYAIQQCARKKKGGTPWREDESTQQSLKSYKLQPECFWKRAIRPPRSKPLPMRWT